MFLNQHDSTMVVDMAADHPYQWPAAKIQIRLLEQK